MNHILDENQLKLLTKIFSDCKRKPRLVHQLASRSFLCFNIKESNDPHCAANLVIHNQPSPLLFVKIGTLSTGLCTNTRQANENRNTMRRKMAIFHQN